MKQSTPSARAYWLLMDLREHLSPASEVTEVAAINAERLIAQIDALLPLLTPTCEESMTAWRDEEFLARQQAQRDELARKAVQP